MRRAGGGSIIIMSSVAGLRGSGGLAGYCAMKRRREAVREGGMRCSRGKKSGRDAAPPRGSDA
jgi:NADP-dependent 3-hydroxy acid dehydrogenase YdfG